MIHKPFFALSVVNLLNGEAQENGFGEAQAAGRKPFSCEGVRVLAVDDEEMNLVVAKGVLGSYGIQVDTCLGGKEAVERCLSTSYDIIFLDHMMPGFDGVETLKQIREIKNGIYQDLPVIALTANTISGAREMFRNEGFTEFIPKPIERAVLERVLRKVLQKHQVQYDEIQQEAVQEEFLPEENSLEEILMEETLQEETFSEDPVPEKELIPEEDLIAEEEPVSKEDSIPKKKSVSKEDPIPKKKSASKEDPVPKKKSASPKASVPKEKLIPKQDPAPEAAPVSEYAPLAKIGINIQLGLDYCCGEDDFYKEMLQMFCSQAVEKRAELVSLYETANWADYTVKVHALKSTAMTIGAERLAEEARLLEQAGKEGNTGYIRHGHPILLHLYDQVCETITGL